MRISEEKKKKISEQILSLLFQENPHLLFTSQIAKEVARDEEFTKSLLEEMKEKKLVVKITKNKEGITYLKRLRWKLSEKAYLVYKEAQN
ncbi:MAG: hypothetical protein NUV46_01970 [Nanoarchaeota archaeon]|nr:hypothetical protein [Nanoarchaeota archaeon]